MVLSKRRLGTYYMVLSIRRLGTYLYGAEHKKTWYTVNGTEQNKPINSFHDEIKIRLLRVLLASNDCDGVGCVKVCARMHLWLL